MHKAMLPKKPLLKSRATRPRIVSKSFTLAVDMPLADAFLVLSLPPATDSKSKLQVLASYPSDATSKFGAIHLVCGFI